MPAPTYNLPWNRQEPDPDFSDVSSNSGNEKSPLGSLASYSSFTHGSGGNGSGGNPPVSASGSASHHFAEEIDDSLLLDAEALIGNAMKMGIKNQILPRAPRKISIFDIPDLLIVDTLEPSTHGSGTPRRQKRHSHNPRDSFGSGSDFEGSEYSQGSFDSSSGGGDQATTGSTSNGSSAPALASLSMAPDLDGASIDEAIRNFQANYTADSEIEAMKEQYTAIFCAMQRELREAKKRIAKLTRRLDEKSDENAAFRSDIETLQDALTSVQLADKANELVVDDLKQLMDKKKERKTSSGGSTSSGSGKKKVGTPPPENFY